MEKINVLVGDEVFVLPGDLKKLIARLIQSGVDPFEIAGALNVYANALNEYEISSGWDYLTIDVGGFDKSQLPGWAVPVRADDWHPDNYKFANPGSCIEVAACDLPQDKFWDSLTYKQAGEIVVRWLKDLGVSSARLIDWEDQENAGG